jgi:hypothetical protein
MRRAVGRIRFEYSVEGDNEAEGLSDTELASYFTDRMLEDVYDLSWLDLRGEIEVELLDL